MSIAIVLGFFLLHLVEKSFATHEPHESDYGSDHDHRHVVGTLSAVAFIGHVFLDGVGIGAAFQVSHTLGYAVFLALLIHAFSDGLNTVAFLIKGGRWTAKAKLLLIADAIARTAGAALGSYVLISANGVASRISLAITRNVYGRRSASSTTEKPELASRLDSGRASGGNSWRGSVIERRF